MFNEMKYFYSFIFLFQIQLQISVQDANILNSKDTVIVELEKFNSFYMTNLEQRMITILRTMSSLDENIKSLQEKAHVWEIFRHHINAWSDHIKSVDNKLDLLKRAQEADQLATLPLETRLSAMDFKVQHIFEKIDTINEKLHDISKALYTPTKRVKKIDDIPITVPQNDILQKLSLIERNTRLIQNHCRLSRPLPKPITSSITRSVPTSDVDKIDMQSLKISIDRLNLAIDKISSKELRQVLGNNRRALSHLMRMSESIEDVIHEVDDRTMRMYDADAKNFNELSSCCKSTEHEITTFTNSADLLLKKIETLVHTSSKKVSCSKDPIIIGDDEEEELGSGGGSDENETFEFLKPNLNSCDELENRKNGVYLFGYNRDKNGFNRDFNERYCQFATKGPAWTIIQKRELLEENFNRTWKDYKMGFGDLSREFWLGNEFISKLSKNDPMELRIEIEDNDKNIIVDQYTTFHIESEKQNYKMIIHDYRDGTLLNYNGQMFNTFDNKNDKSIGINCTILNIGWWTKRDCLRSNLNDPIGIMWNGVIVEKSKMMIRSKWHSTLDEDDYLVDDII